MELRKEVIRITYDFKTNTHAIWTLINQFMLKLYNY